MATSPPGSLTPVMAASMGKNSVNELGSAMSTMYHPRTEGLSLAEVRVLCQGLLRHSILEYLFGIQDGKSSNLLLRWNEWPLMVESRDQKIYEGENLDFCLIVSVLLPTLANFCHNLLRSELTALY